MTDVELATKTCTKCEATKPLTAFYRSPTGIQGRHSWCSDCSKASVKEARAKKRSEMGDDAWKDHQAEIVRKHRRQWGSDPTGSTKAYKMAEAELREKHRNEFEAILQRIRYELGL